MAPQYSDREYWDKRYGEATGFFEWYHGYDALREVRDAHLSRSIPILQVGVGTSALQLDMVLDGYHSITNVDYSAVAIERMREMHKGVCGLHYVLADCRDMRGVIEDESFGTVLDKGTLDAMLCGADAFDSAARLLLEVSRVLIPGGLFVLITYGGPDFRLPYLEAPACDWDVLVYVLTRHEGGRGRSPASSPKSCGGWQADAGGSWWPPHANFSGCGGGGGGGCEPSEGGGDARGESEERGACGGGSSVGDTSYGECTSREGLQSDGSDSGGSCSEDSGVQVQGPFQPWLVAHRTLLSQLSTGRDLHFMYVCRKRTQPRPPAEPAGAADAAPAASPRAWA